MKYFLSLLVLPVAVFAQPSVLHYDINKDKYLHSKNINQTRPIASITKLMTAMVVLDSNPNLHEKLSLSKKVKSSLPRQQFSRIDLLNAMLVKSDNGAAETLADNYPGGRKVFIEDMNRNAFSYGIYLVIVKKLMDKYNAFTFVKWIYTFGFIMVLPFGWNEFQAVRWAIIPMDILWKIGFVVVFSTFFTYLFNLLSMRELSPTTIAVFIYLQPLFATIFAISLGKDELTLVKIVSAVLIFVGVYLVTQKRVKSD